MKRMTKRLSFLLALVLLLSALAACAPSDGDPTETGDKPSADASPSTNGEETFVPQESGTLGDGATPTEEPDPVKPPNPVKSLLAKSQEDYDGGNLGCTGLTVLAEYNRGVDFDIQSYRDHNGKIFYLYLPCRANMASVTFSVTHRDGSESGPYTADFSDEEVSDNESVMGNASRYEIRVMQSDLPSVMLEIDETYGTVAAMNADPDHATYAYGAMVATATDAMAREKGWQTRYESREEDATEYGSMKMRGRGNATWDYSKKPYQLVTENSLDLFGMGSAKKYVLLANYNDAANQRSQLALEMSRMLGVPYTSEYRQVDVFLNGSYIGLYMIVEKVEVGESRVAIDHRDDILFEKDNYAADEEFGFQTEYTNYRKRGFRVHSPEDAEGLLKAKRVIERAENALYQGSDDDFAACFDLESWAKMYLIQMYTMNNDAYYGSMFFYYNSEDGKLYACAPWDFDWAFGVSYSASELYLNPMKFDVEGVEWMKPMIKRHNFLRAVCEEFYENGGKTLLEHMPALVEKYAEENRRSAEMNASSIPVRYYPENGVTDYDTAVTFLQDICTQRVQFMVNKIRDLAARCGYTMP